MAKPKFAFQCNNCGALEPAAAAGDNALPRSCHICRKGDGDPDNWKVLAGMSPKELSKLGLKADDIEKHTVRNVSPPQGQTITREIKEGIGSNENA